MNAHQSTSLIHHHSRAVAEHLLVAGLCFVMMSTAAWGAATYTWNVASGSWATAASWNPARTTPAADDILVFDGAVQAAPTATSVARETVGRLRVINSCTATLSSGTPVAGAGTIARSGTTVTGTGTAFTTFFAVGDFLYTGANANLSRITAIASDTSLTTAESGTIAAATAYTRATVLKVTGNEPGFEVAAGSTLTVSATTPILTTLQAGALGSVSGAVVFAGGPHKLWVIDASGLTFQNGSSIKADTGFTGNAFGTVNLNSVIFASGSTYIYNALSSGNPFGAGAPNSVCIFQTGSLYSHRIQGSGPAFSGRTYANFEYNNAASETQLTVSGGGGVNVDNVAVIDGVFGFGMTVTASIKGNVSVASGATLNFNPSAATVLTFNGSSPQTISGAGTLTFNANEQLAVANGSTVTLARNIPVANSLTVNGTFNCAANAVTGAGTFTLPAGGTLGVGSVDGLSSTAATGNIQVTGTRTYNAAANFVYNGTAAQVTGNQFPATVNNFTVNNSAGVTLSANVAVNGTTTVSSGSLDLNAKTVTGTATIAPGGTLKGTGNVTGVVTVNSGGTVAPGTSIGTLTLGAAPSLGGTLLMEITSPSSADKLNVTSGTVTFGGTLTVTNIGGGLANGNTFDLFDGTLAGSFSTLNLPGGLGHWNTSDLNVGGTITFNNSNPSANDFSLGVAVGGSTTASVISKYAAATDADGDIVTITSVSSPANGTATIVGGTNIIYTSTVAAGSDSFTYTVSDGLGGTDTKTVTVTISSPQGFNLLSGPINNGNGTYTINYLGIPSAQYALDTTASLTPPITWTPVLTNTAAGDGALSFTFPTGDSQGFFRTRYVP